MKTTELLSDYELERGKPLPNTLAKRSDAPLLCVEIQSFSQSPEEMIEKVARYFAFGVKYCWVVVPSLQAVLVYDQPSHYQSFHGGDVLRDPGTGIGLSLPDIFA